MKNIQTWQKPAIAPVFGMPICGSASHAARVRVDAVRTTGLTAAYGTPGSDAWSPPFS
jgi:hypothetical protein